MKLVIREKRKLQKNPGTLVAIRELVFQACAANAFDPFQRGEKSGKNQQNSVLVAVPSESALKNQPLSA